MFASTPSRSLLLVLAALLGGSELAPAQELGLIAREYGRLVQLGQSRRNRPAFDRQYLRLSQMAPSDADIPYTHALLLTNQRNYKDAAKSAGRALAINPNNVDACKLYVWLQLNNKNYVPALRCVGWLAKAQDADGLGPGVEDLSDYFGTVVGYLAGPRGDDLPSYDLVKHEKNIRSYLDYAQATAFDAARDRVTAEFASKALRISGERENAYNADVGARGSQIEQMAQERARIQAELAGIEELRLKSKVLAAGERNTIAATRERIAGGSFSRTADDGVRISGTQVLGGVVNRGQISGYDYDNVSGSSMAASRGLGRAEYKNVNDRQQDYDNHLAGKEAALLRQLQVMERKEVALRNKPVVGSSRRVAQLERKAKLVTAYLAMPVDPEAEVSQLLADLSRGQAAGPVAQVRRP